MLPLKLARQNLFSLRHFVNSSFLELSKFTLEKMIWYFSVKHNLHLFGSGLYALTLSNIFHTRFVLVLTFFFPHKIWKFRCITFTFIFEWVFMLAESIFKLFLVSQYNEGDFQLYLACLVTVSGDCLQSSLVYICQADTSDII